MSTVQYMFDGVKCRGKGLLTIRFTKFYIPFSLKRYLFRSPSIENTTRLLHDLSNKNESLKQEVSMSLRVTFSK